MYLDKCQYKELLNPHRYEFTGPCVVTGKPYTVTIPDLELFRLRQGVHIQDACITLSADDREFILTGISPEGWDQMFNIEEEEENDELDS